MTTHRAGEQPALLRGLKLRRVVFVEKFLEHGDGKRAALEAGYSPSGAKQEAHRLLQMPEVRAELERRRREIDGDLRASVLAELERIAFADPRRLFLDVGGLRLVSDWPEATARAVAYLEAREREDGGSEVKVVMHDKLRALHMLARIRGLYEADHQNSKVRISESMRDLVQLAVSYTSPVTK